MPQTGVPTADITNANHFLDNLGSSVTIFDTIDEAALSTADWIQSSAGLSTAVYVCALTTTMELPTTTSSGSISFTYRKNSSGGSQINLEVQLRENYVSEASLGTAISSQSFTNISSSTQTTSVMALSSVVIATITAPSSLVLRFIVNQV